MIAVGQSVAERIAELSPNDRQQLLASFSDEQIKELHFDWKFWARPDQLLPTHKAWFTWLLMSGRGAGKTRTGSETIREWVGGPKDPPIRIALVAESSPDARDVMVEGESGLLNVCPPWNRPIYQPSKRRLVWPNGSVAITFSGDKPDQLRGPQFHKGWVDELAKFQYPQDVWDNLELGLRLGTNPQVLVTTTPRPLPIIRELMGDPMTVLSQVSTYANLSNLAPQFIRRIISKYEGTRLGLQELHGKLLMDIEGALWNPALIEDNRIGPDDVPPLARIVVGVDPAESEGEESNETGIVVVGKSPQIRERDQRVTPEQAFLLRDASGSYSPGEWAKMAIKMYYEYGASCIVVERNKGGDMIKVIIHSINANVRVKTVWAHQSKGARAEPVAALMEQGRVKHVGHFATLEDQLILMRPEEYMGGGSPDRADAYVHAISDLMLGKFQRDEEDDYEEYRR